MSPGLPATLDGSATATRYAAWKHIETTLSEKQTGLCGHIVLGAGLHLHLDFFRFIFFLVQ